MKVTKTPFEGLLIIEPTVYPDYRGCFYETFSEKYQQLGIPPFCQENISYSHKGVLRGLHYQRAPFAQGKLVECLEGKILDVAVDLRPYSKTRLHHYKILLGSDDAKQFYIPPGFAHGFYVISDEAIVCYRVTAPYNKECDAGIVWNDPDIKIPWAFLKPTLSEKDASLPRLNDAIL